MRKVNDKERIAVSALAAPDRYSHFIRHVADNEELWSLKSTDGWVLMAATAGPELVPVWPHPIYARAYAEGVWQGAEPEAIPLDRWIEGWTTGMTRDGRQVAVFPVPGGQGIVVTPEQLRTDLQEECSQYDYD